MSWLLAVWISLGFLLFCQATLYQTIQQHHVARPGHTDILTLGRCHRSSTAPCGGAARVRILGRSCPNMTATRRHAAVLHCSSMIHHARSQNEQSETVDGTADGQLLVHR
ncbi:unnamed protein product [Tetraodon nigroviridis]|uniref:(spotted green pufferfish) hypothetical protein n=1 Tax=Tetraodon nigroviridis TaxID=99883 RepID=Q4SBE1_TETNG|nr:unnamed protein product [Tetraodon nigroviridis]